jgi:hypothetical protein
MPDQKFTLRDPNGKPVLVFIRRDKRLKKTSRWGPQPDGSLLVRVPYRLPKYRLSSLLSQVASQLDKLNQPSTRRTDTDLQLRAELINRKYFHGKIQWHAIRWVSNMQQRLGSCTRGGPTDGHIRISDKIKNWPDFVIDYVIAHELVHRLHPSHADGFWQELNAAFPHAERARGFIDGVGFAAGQPLEDD